MSLSNKHKYHRTHVAAFGLDLLDLFFETGQKPLPALGQSLFILLEKPRFQIPKSRGKRLWLIIRS